MISAQNRDREGKIHTAEIRTKMKYMMILFFIDEKQLIPVFFSQSIRNWYFVSIHQQDKITVDISAFQNFHIF